MIVSLSVQTSKRTLASVIGRIIVRLCTL